MKRIRVLFATGVLAALLAGCNGEAPPTTADEPTQPAKPPPNNPPPGKPKAKYVTS